MAYINLVPSELTVGVGETKTVTIDTNGSGPYYTVIWDDAQEIAALDPFLPDAETIETTTIKVTGVSVGTTWFEITINEGQSARCDITVTAESSGGDSGGSSGGDSGTTESRSVKLIPTSGSGSSWSNIANAYDNNTSTSATVAVTSSNYTSRAGTFIFDTSVIPSGATINSATLTVNIKSSNSNRTTLYADINGSSSNRVINQRLSTTQADYTADVSSYMSSLNSVVLTIYNSRTTSYTITTYEIWIDVDYTVYVAPTIYTVTFKDWDGTVLKTQEVEQGSSATAPANPTRTGYTFTSWDKAFTNVTSNLTVTAQYTINSYTVIFKDWDGAILKTQTVNYGGNATPPSDPVRDGYAFTGWSGSYTNITSNVDIVAQYEGKPQTKNLYIGGKRISNICLGSKKIIKAYLGSMLIYENVEGGDSGSDTPGGGDTDTASVWAYKDDDFSNKTTDETITKAYIELTSANYKTRIDEVLQWYPNCTDLYFFDDGSVTSLDDMFYDNNTGTKNRITKVDFMNGYFTGLTTMKDTFNGCLFLTSVSNTPDSVTSIFSTFNGCSKLTECAVPLTNTSSYTDCLANCSSLTNIIWIGERTKTLNLSYLNAPSHTQADIKELVNEHLGTVSDRTLRLGDTYLAYLTQEEITAAENKGWMLL